MLDRYTRLWREERQTCPRRFSGLEIVNAGGRKWVKLSRAKDGETFQGAVVGLGALGAVTKVTLDLQPSYQMQQYVYENLPLDELTRHFDAIESAAYRREPVHRLAEEAYQ